MNVLIEFFDEEPIENLITCTHFHMDKVICFGYKPVMTLAKAGVVNGVSEGVFAPTEKTTRAQVAVILDRLYNA